MAVLSNIEVNNLLGNFFRDLNSLVTKEEKELFEADDKNEKGKIEDEVYQFLRLQRIFNNKSMELDRKVKFINMFYHFLNENVEKVKNVINDNTWLTEKGEFILKGEDINRQTKAVPFNIDVSFFIKRAIEIKNKAQDNYNAGIDEDREDDDYYKDETLLYHIFLCFQTPLKQGSELKREISKITNHYGINAEITKKPNVTSSAFNGILSGLGVPESVLENFQELDLSESFEKISQSETIKGIMGDMMNFNQGNEVEGIRKIFARMGDERFLNEVKSIIPGNKQISKTVENIQKASSENSQSTYETFTNLVDQVEKERKGKEPEDS